MINESRFILTQSAAPDIIAEYQVLLMDGEPLVYTGKNIYGSRIIGSLLYIDSVKKCTYYLHVVVSSQQYVQYVQKQITYRDIVLSTNDIFVLQTHHADETKIKYSVSLDQLPAIALPTDQTYYPVDEIIYGSNFQFKLTGLKADEHKADPSAVSNIIIEGEKLIRASSKMLTEFCDFKISPYCIPSKAASYSVSFAVNAEKRKSDFFISEEVVNNVISSILGYCINYLPIEYRELIVDNDLSHKYTDLLEQLLNDLYIDRAKDGFEKKLKQSIFKVSSSIAKISKNVGKKFSELTISNEGKVSNILGCFDEASANSFIDVQESISNILEPIMEDEEPKTYHIIIYSLNVDTRKGKALLLKDDDPDSFWRTNFVVEGEDELTHSRFSESLDQIRKIEVNAKARRKVRTKQITYLHIKYE